MTQQGMRPIQSRACLLEGAVDEAGSLGKTFCRRRYYTMPKYRNRSVGFLIQIFVVLEREL